MMMTICLIDDALSAMPDRDTVATRPYARTPIIFSAYDAAVRNSLSEVHDLRGALVLV